MERSVTDRVDADRLPQLTDELDQYLRQPWYRVKFTPALMRRYLLGTAETRVSQLRWGLLGLAALHVAFLLPDWIQGHQILMLGLLLRGCISIPLLLAGAFVLRRDLPGWAEFLAAATPPIIAFFIDEQCARHVTGLVSDRYFMGAAMTMFISNVLLPLRRPHAIVYAVMNIATYDATLFGAFGPLSFGKPQELAVVLSVLLVISAGIRWRADMHERQSFLLTERDRIQSKQLAWANRQLTVLSYTDPLTGLANRRFFDDALLRLWGQAMDLRLSLSVLMIDIDHFKRFNDSLGHAAGDKCLRRVAQAMQFCVRADKDSLARCGGEEFIAMIPGASVDEAVQIAERIRVAVQDLQIKHPSNPLSQYVSVCVGVATAENVSSVDKADVLLNAADFALYTAKSRGRNCVATQELTSLPAQSSIDTAHSLQLHNFAAMTPVQ